MTDFKENEIVDQDLIDWYNINVNLKKLKKEEIYLRNKIFRRHFDNLEEGTNKIKLNNKFTLVSNYSSIRSIDKGLLLSISEQLKEAGISIDTLVNISMQPKLNKKGYNLLTDAQRLIFDQALIIKSGTPSLTIRKDKK